MKKFFIIFALSALLGACTGVGPDVAKKVQNAYELAARNPTIHLTTGKMGIARGGPQENALFNYGFRNPACVDHTARFEGTQLETSLCMPDWMWNIPSDSKLSFHMVNAGTGRIIYIVSSSSISKYRYYRSYRRYRPY